jgi:hypothetical protein
MIEETQPLFCFEGRKPATSSPSARAHGRRCGSQKLALCNGTCELVIRTGMAERQQLTALGIDCGSHTFVATLAQSTSAAAAASFAIVRNSLSNSETPAIFACSSSRLMVGEAAVAERETGGNKFAAPTLGLASPPHARLPELSSEFATSVFGDDGMPLMPYGGGTSFSFQHMVGSLLMEVSAPVRAKSDAASVSFFVTSPFADLEFARAMKDAAFITGCGICFVLLLVICIDNGRCPSLMRFFLKHSNN